MLSDELADILTWLVYRAMGSIGVHGVDVLGAPMRHPERVVQRVADGWTLHEVDRVGQPLPRPFAHLRPLDDGQMGLFVADLLGQPHHVAGWIWRAGPVGLELAEADPRGRGEPRPLVVLVADAPAGADALVPVSVGGGFRSRPRHVVLPVAGGHALTGLDPLGVPLQRPSRLLFAR